MATSRRFKQITLGSHSTFLREMHFICFVPLNKSWLFLTTAFLVWFVLETTVIFTRQSCFVFVKFPCYKSLFFFTFWCSWKFSFVPFLPRISWLSDNLILCLMLPLIKVVTYWHPFIHLSSSSSHSLPQLRGNTRQPLQNGGFQGIWVEIMRSLAPQKLKKTLTFLKVR